MGEYADEALDRDLSAWLHETWDPPSGPSADFCEDCGRDTDFCICNQHPREI